MNSHCGIKINLEGFSEFVMPVFLYHIYFQVKPSGFSITCVKRMMKYFFSFILFCYSVGFAQPQIPKLKMWATDFTNTLNQSELNELNNRLKSYEDTTSNQVLVLMIPSLEGRSIEEFALEIGRLNKIGTEKLKNGVLLLIAKDDRELDIEVGYGLEGAVPDAISSSIIRNVITPKFKTDDYYLGISDGINAIIAAIGGEYKAEKTDNDSGGFPSIIFIIIFIVIWLFISKGGPFVPGGIYRTGTHSRGWSGGSSNWGGSSGWSGGGGFSGGGGSFGGGGASGSW